MTTSEGYFCCKHFTLRVCGAAMNLFLTIRRLPELADPLIDAARWNGLRVVVADASRLRVSTRSNAPLPRASEVARRAGDDRPQPLSHPTRSNLPEAA
jgi:hypothetical protein